MKKMHLSKLAEGTMRRVCGCKCLVGMPDLSACMLHGSAAESSSSKSLSLLSAFSFPVVSLHQQLSAPKTSFWCRTDSNPGRGAGGV